ncbi:hypothetical protein RJ639_040864 [Escallonia herrerae]|uniref:Glycosyl hydrolase family 13 catalytic domain-containing protein n=1 Tax=Escallonia herrerae TaxID=1293975 RepID=A0AA89B4X0_9ASTE|nr:hypothetical protein RJ639_040864 [Escallonia herrerae]
MLMALAHFSPAPQFGQTCVENFVFCLALSCFCCVCGVADHVKERSDAHSVRRLDSGKHKTAYVYGQRAEERVLEQEAPEMSGTSPLLKIFPGQAYPLGVSEVENGINFAIFSQHATSVTLCLSLPESKTGMTWTLGKTMEVDEKDKESFRVEPLGGDEKNGNDDITESRMVGLRLDCDVNRTGNIWHIHIEDLPRNNVLYGYHIDGPQGWHQGHRFDGRTVLIDPYAKLIEGRRIFGDVSNKGSKMLGTYDFDGLPFDWGENYKLPNIPEKDLVIYEMNVRAFTADESSGLHSNIRGSYLGVIEKDKWSKQLFMNEIMDETISYEGYFGVKNVKVIPHLLELGINAVELLPVFEFDELEFQRRPNPRDHMINTWGYSTINFFALMSRYASAGGGPVHASREFKEMVKALHNAGIEVILDVVYNHTNEADDVNPYTTSFRGIDNKVVEYHVDGFRFDLASVLCRGTDGSPLNAPPIVRQAIAKDGILSRCKIIAEPWDCGGLCLVGKFPNWDRWAEWNGKYRDDVRRFMKVMQA